MYFDFSNKKKKKTTRNDLNNRTIEWLEILYKDYDKIYAITN